jgi:endogenous inhibitor of DNA gyrase (YacG/DUF329 family)
MAASAKAGASSQEAIEAARHRPATDPPTRADGRCVVCLKARPVVAVAHDDPFCSSRCSRAWYGNELEERNPNEEGNDEQL